ncbi:MAG: hypothetical protein KDA89_12200, partial [Planctomycetaceae bacterium]|nr:hypothetical protein [Planctomycetaceae bacterium]
MTVVRVPCRQFSALLCLVIPVVTGVAVGDDAGADSVPTAIFDYMSRDEPVFAWEQLQKIDH